MSRLKPLALLGLLACLCAPLAAAGWWDALSPRDLEGATVPLKTRWVVLVFVSTDCPLSNASLPTVTALAKAYPQATFLAVYEDCDEPLSKLRAHARDYALGFGAVDDRGQTLAAFAKASYTPEVAVYAETGTLLYRGRIDDKQDDVGEAKPSATVHDLAEVLSALASGKPGPFAFHPGFGCALPRKVTP